MICRPPVSGRLSDKQGLHDQGNAVLVDYSPFWIALASQGRSRFGGTTAYLDASLTCRSRRSGRANEEGPIMCVYCKDAPACDHERDACATSRGEFCAKCGHRSAAIVSYKPRSGGLRPTWRVRRRSPTQVASGGAGMGPLHRLPPYQATRRLRRTGGSMRPVLERSRAPRGQGLLESERDGLQPSAQSQTC